MPPSELWRTLEVRSGESTTPSVPVLVRGKPAYLSFVHGFKPTKPGVIMIDIPNTFRHVDARSGTLIEERRFAEPRGDVQAVAVDDGALSRIGPALELLAPLFFDGQPAVPKDLDAVAEQYRADFPRAIQPELLPLYKEHAAEWFKWVGLP